MVDPLFIFIDLEAAHGNNYFGDIIELAAQVDPRVIENETFSSLINTKQNLSYFALQISKISREDLRGKQYFGEVFKEFVDWVSKVVSKCDKIKKKKFAPVLVAHGGFDNDFMMLQSNIDRHEMDLDILNQFRFADTYMLAKRLKCKDIGNLWKCQLSIEMMYKHFFPDEVFKGQHRALADVKFMIRIFLGSPIAQYFDDIPIAVFDERKEEYIRKNTSKVEKGLLDENLPKGMAKVTHNMTLNRLLRNGLTYSRLISFFESAECTFDFYDKLKDMGIERKASKSLAAHLLSLGYCCRGAIEKEQRNKAGDDEDDKKIQRTDSGYESVHLNDEQWLDRFYTMFVEEFWYGPEQYEYQYGSITTKEMEEIDIAIDDLFNELFGDDMIDTVGPDGSQVDDSDVHVKQSSESPVTFIGQVQENNLMLNEDEISNLGLKFGDIKFASSDAVDELRNESFIKAIENGQDRLQFGDIGDMASQLDEGVDMNNLVDQAMDIELSKGVTTNNSGDSVEDWDSEVHNVREFHLGGPVKNIPIGISMNDFSGREFEERVPLLKHFNTFDMESRPEDGLPTMSRREKNKQRRKNRQHRKEQEKLAVDPHSGSGHGRTYGRTDKGEIIILV
ncbi:uncharacterized protein [Clytia hemisphaerica]|uniref:Exonuclease domain-containing protein n=1 Tax=Clytia hemisphaerica TaxID=252671 RepID=A0A7M5UWR4_9CNID